MSNIFIHEYYETHSYKMHIFIHEYYETQGCSYGGRRRAGPPTTHDFRPALIFFLFFVPGTMFHNRGSIIAQYTYVIYIENDLVRLWIPAGAPQVVGAALRWLHSLRLPLLFTIINHHSDWAGYNPAETHSYMMHSTFANASLYYTIYKIKLARYELNMHLGYLPKKVYSTQIPLAWYIIK